MIERLFAAHMIMGYIGVVLAVFGPAALIALARRERRRDQGQEGTPVEAPRFVADAMREPRGRHRIQRPTPRVVRHPAPARVRSSSVYQSSSAREGDRRG